MAAITTKINWIAAMTWTFALVLTFSMSCRKKENEDPPSPTPTPTPADTIMFYSSPHRLMTLSEISNQKLYSGSFFYQVGKGLYSRSGHGKKSGLREGGIDIPYFEIAEVLWEIYDYKQTSAEFEKIDKELKVINDKIDELKNEMTQLSQQLNLNQATILNAMNTLASNTWVTTVNTAFDSSNTGGLRYYSKTANLIKNNQISMTMEQLDNSCMKDFVSRYGPTGSISMQNCINQLRTLMLGSATGTSFDASSLKQFADVLILSQLNSSTSSDYLLNLFKVHENYFLTYMNSQFRAFTVWSNAMYRSLGDDTAQANYQYKTYLASFTKIIQDELSVFLTVTDYLSVNLSDYRNLAEFNYDMQHYSAYGVKPDDKFGPFIARANMLNQLVNFALGVPLEDCYLTVAVPANYSHSSNLKFYMSDGGLQTGIWDFNIDNHGSLPSRFPYTGWTYVKKVSNSVSPDNKITFYRGNQGEGSRYHNPLGNTMYIALKAIPWRCIKSGQGVGYVGYYNPNDLTADPSNTYDSAHCLPFGSASLCWYWGEQYLNDTTVNNLKDGKHMMWSYTSFGNGYYADSPLAYDPENQIDYISTYSSNMILENNRIGYSGETGKIRKLDLGRIRTGEINVSASTSTYNPSISFYCYYDLIPSTIMDGSRYYYISAEQIPRDHPTGNILNYVPGMDQTGLISVELNPGNYTFYVGFYSMTKYQSSFSSILNWDTQIIYGGTYNIFMK